MAVAAGKKTVMRGCGIRDGRRITVLCSMEYRIPFSRGKWKEKS